MSSAKAVTGAEGEALKKLAKTGRALLEAAAEAELRIDNKPYYHLPTLPLLEFAAAMREAEAIVD